MSTINAEINRYLETSQINVKEEAAKHREELIMKYAPLVKNIVGRLAAKLPIDLSDKEDLINLYKKFQESIHNDEPVTFLFWIDNIVVYHSKIKILIF